MLPHECCHCSVIDVVSTRTESVPKELLTAIPGVLTVLYHATSLDAAVEIRKNGFICGKQGVAGPGIYFAKGATQARYKSRQNGQFLVVLQCKVRLGNVFEICASHTHDASSSYRLNMQKAGCHSIKITGERSKGTYCVYSPSQIECIR